VSEGGFIDFSPERKPHSLASVSNLYIRRSDATNEFEPAFRADDEGDDYGHIKTITRMPQLQP
jgi:hypothetical protein